jgi:hypothetical protein
MNKKTNRFPVRKTGLVLGLSLACSLFTGSVGAQWIVEDPTSIFHQIQEYAQTAARWERTAQQYEDQLNHYTQEMDHYNQELIDLQRLNFNMTQMVNDFPIRDDNWGVADACPGPSTGGGVSGIINSAIQKVLPAIGDNVSATQQQICEQIVTSQNRKYNTTVQLLNRLVQYQTDFMTGIESQRNSSGTSQGALSANDNETQRFLARTTLDLQFWQTNMAAYDEYIASLKRQQGLQAKHAMSGSDILGQVINAAALKGALSQ